MQRIAQVLKSNGRDGELLLGFVGIAPEDIDTQEPVFIEFDGLPVPFYFESFTPRGNNRALVRLTGVHSLADADELAGAAVYAEDDLYEDEEMHLFTCPAFSGTLHECDEGVLEWVDKAKVPLLPLWEGDRVFLRLLAQDAPFFRLKLRYEGDSLRESRILEDGETV